MSFWLFQAILKWVCDTDLIRGIMNRIIAVIVVSVSLLGISREARLMRRPESGTSSGELTETMTITPPYFTDFEDDDGLWIIIESSEYCQWQQVWRPETIQVATDIFPSRVDYPEEADGHSEALLPSAKSGEGCFWYGNPENGTFIGEPYYGGIADDGGMSIDMNSGWLVSPEFETYELEHILLSFWTWWEVECIDIDEYDLMHVKVTTDGGLSWEDVAMMNPPFSRLVDWWEWESYSSGGYLHYGRWVRWYLSLDDYVGENIHIAFQFETVDMLYNGFRGWLIDDFSISGTGGHSELRGLDSLTLVNCRPWPDTLLLEAWIENIGDVTMYNTQAELRMPDHFNIISGENPVHLGDLFESSDADCAWEVSLDTIFEADTSLTFEVEFTTRHPVEGYFDDFDDSEPLFSGSGTGSDRWTYQNVSGAGGPTDAHSGFGVAGIPAGVDEYSGGLDESLTSTALDLSGFDACYISFWYWMDVPDVGSLFDTRTIDGGLLEIDNGSGWVMVDEFAVGALQPRYDEYLDDIFGNPLGGRLAWSLPQTEWTKVRSQDLFSLGYCSEGDIVRFRFRFGSSDFDGYSQGEGWFIDDFSVKSAGFDVGPFISRHTVFIPGSSVPEYDFIFPWDGAISACDTQEIAIGFTGYRELDTTRIFLTVDGSLYDLSAPELSWDGEQIVFVPSEIYEADCTVDVFLDSIYTDEGCAIYPLEWSFFVDVTTPDIEMLSPSGGVIADPLEQLCFILLDMLSGIDTTSIIFTYNDTDYDLSDPGLLLRGDTLIFDPVLAGTALMLDTICYVYVHDSPQLCSPNPASGSFKFVWGDPVITPLFPEEGIVSSCEFQAAIFVYNDISPLDSTSVILEVNGEILDWLSEGVNITGDTITYIPPVPFANGQNITVSILEARNILGIEWEGIAQLSFFIDLEPPIALLTLPTDITVPNRMPQIEIEFSDNLAGINNDSTIFAINGEETGFSLSGDDLTYLPDQPFIAGDTVWITLHLADMARLCGANSSSMDTFFVISPETGCEIWPNPFTPNNDGFSDIAFFSYPDRYFQSGELLIFTKRGEEIYRNEIINDDIHWNGRDKQGSLASPGLYLYLILVEGEKLCEGTVVLIR